MKKYITLGFLLIILGVVILKQEQITAFINKYILKKAEQEVTLGEKNEYYRDYDFDYVQNTDDFTPENRQEILNIYYTAINAGKKSFTFYCPTEYEDCISEIRNIANDQETLSHINNFVHPYNGFQHIETEYDNSGKVTITIQKSYTTEEIQAIDEKINEIQTTVMNQNLSVEENIRLAHDYIINHSIYDSDRSDRNIINYKSDIAYGPLIEGYGICGGYTDAMELILEKLNIKSYKVSSNNHIWNALLLNNQWLHLDLTWNDPVTSNHTNILEHNFFLIPTATLLNIEQEQHTFDQTIYRELEV